MPAAGRHGLLEKAALLKQIAAAFEQSGPGVSGRCVKVNVESRMLEVEKAAIDSQGAQRLNEIRHSLALEKGTSPAVDPGGSSSEAAPFPAEQQTSDES